MHRALDSLGRVVNRYTHDSKAWLTLASGDLIYKGAMAVYWVLLARVLSVDNLGIIALANAIAMPAYLILDAGLTNLFVKDCSLRPGTEGIPQSHRRRARHRLMLGLAGVPVLAACGGLMGGSLNAGLATGFMCLAYLLDFGGQLMLAPKRAATVMSPDAAFRTVQAVGTVVLTVLIFLMDEKSVVLVAMASTLAYLIAWGLAWNVWRSSSGWALGVQPSLALQAEATETRLVSQGTILMAVNGRIDSILVQLFLGSAALATYTVAMKLIELARLLPGSLSRVVLARSSDSAISHYDFRAHFRLSLFIGTSSAVLLLLFGPSLIGLLFGSEYLEMAKSTVRMLGLSMIPYALAAPALMFALGSGRTRLLRRVAAELVIVTLVAIIALALPFGLNGVAAGVVISQWFAAIRFWWSLRNVEV